MCARVIFLIRFDDLSYRAVFRLVGYARGRGLTFTFARVLVRALTEGPSQQLLDIRDRCLCNLCSYAPSGRAAAAGVSSPRDRAVSTGSHMRRDMDISKAPLPCLGAPSPLLQIVHVRNLDQKFGGNLPYEMGLVTFFFFFGTRVSRPAGRKTVLLVKCCRGRKRSNTSCPSVVTTRDCVFDTTYTKAARVSSVSGKMNTELADVVPKWF